MSLMLCVDVGHANIGAVVVDLLRLDYNREIEELHFFHTEKTDKKLRYRHSDDQARRSAEAARFYHELISRLSIKRIAIELPSGGAPNSSAATDLARAATVIVSVAEVNDCATEYYTAREAKQAATGHPGASKSQVINAICERYPQVRDQFPTLASGLEHVSDAIAVWLAASRGNLARL